jgi:hypothetical protein
MAIVFGKANLKILLKMLHGQNDNLGGTNCQLPVNAVFIHVV